MGQDKNLLLAVKQLMNPQTFKYRNSALIRTLAYHMYQFIGKLQLDLQFNV